MLGSIDCMHWEWKNCPFSWQGMYKGAKGHCSVVLETVSTHDLWIWHSFFDMPRTHNDINVFVKTISNPVPGGKYAYFAKCQETCRKDVERAFGMLQSRFA